MHYENQPITGNRNTTTRDIADAIDRLIELRISKAFIKDREFSKETDEHIELTIRMIADGLKQHSGASGVYAEPKP